MTASNSEYTKQVVEALIFASDLPISNKQIRSIIEEVTNGEITKLVKELNLEYKQSNRSFHIIQVAGGYQMVTRESYSQWLKKLFLRRIKSRLSQAALETLSVIAFQQPVSRVEVEQIRGVNSDGVVHTLLERKLITIAGRGDGPGRPILYKTTKEFLRYFGVNDLADLPKPREIEEILKEEKESDSDKMDTGILDQLLKETKEENRESEEGAEDKEPLREKDKVTETSDQKKEDELSANAAE